MDERDGLNRDTDKKWIKNIATCFKKWKNRERGNEQNKRENKS